MSRRIPLAALVLVLILSVAPACKPKGEAKPAGPGSGGATGASTEADQDAPESTGAGAPGTRTAPPVLCPDLRPPIVTDRKVLQAPNIPEPPARVPFHDPVFGTCLVRVSDRRTDIASDDSSKGLKNEYSRVQAWNADGSLMVLRGTAATWYLYDARTLRPLRLLPMGGPVDPRWDARDPGLLHYVDGTRLVALEVRSGRTRLVHDFAADFPGKTLASVSTRYEGSPSLDGATWGLMARDADWKPVALLVYDQSAGKVTAIRDLHGAPELDTVTISPRGTTLLAWFDYCRSGKGSLERPCGLMSYSRDLKRARGLLRIVGHGDLALDAGGREVLVYQDVDTDHISMLDLASGAVTTLWPIDFSHTAQGFHISGRAFERPGWALVSTYNGGHPKALTWMDDEVFAVELRPKGRVTRLAHTHARVDEAQEKDYWAEPQASANPDFTRIVFTSNWGRSGTDQVETFMVALPPDWIDRLP